MPFKSGGFGASYWDFGNALQAGLLCTCMQIKGINQKSKNACVKTKPYEAYTLLPIVCT